MSTVKPLDTRKIPVENLKNGIEKEAPAIHEIWKSSHHWTRYSPFNDPNELSVEGAKSFWLEVAESTESDLVWLLELPAHRFWSQILYDGQLQQFLEVLLQQLPREHDPSLQDREVDLHNKQILHALFLVILRLCTYKESPADFFSPDYYATIIYDKFILDLPKIIDICSLFRGCNNRDITFKMMDNVFKCQPMYLNDLFELGLTLEKAFESSGEKLQVLGMKQPSQSSLPGLLDLLSYVTDVSHSVNSLLDVYSPACLPLHQAELELKLASFYQTSVVGLLAQVDKYTEASIVSADQREAFVRSINLARHAIVSAFRTVITTVCLSPLLSQQQQEGGEDVSLYDLLERFLTIFTAAISDRSFIVDYNTRFSVREDFDLFDQAGIVADATRKHYILDGINTEMASKDGRGRTNRRDCEKEKGERGAVGGAVGGSVVQSNDNDATGAGAAAAANGVELASLISRVRDMLPHLGSGFVGRCLEHYSNSVEEVVNAILECNLAPHLMELDQAEERRVEPAAVPEPEPQHQKEVQSVWESKAPRSIFENDEFDVNTRDSIDLTRVHRGKRNKWGDAKKILDDKSELEGMRERFSQLGIVTDYEIMAGEEDEYQDEYDDTYDELAVGQEEPDSREEGELGRRFVLPVALGGGKLPRGNQQQVNEDEDEEDEENGAEFTRMNFARNPEEMRQEAERRRQEKMARRGGRRHGGGGGGGGGGAAASGGGGGGPPVRDMVGKPKGQGQDKQVLINRAKKNLNKGKGQRFAADKKASKGMF